MKTVIKNLTLATFLFFLASGISCTGGSNDSFGTGPNLNPDPEDIFDLPNPLPDSFLIHACPDGIGTSTVMDLEIKIESANAPSHDFDRDGDIDSILLVRGNANPKTLTFKINSLSTPIASSSVDLAYSFSNLFLGGHETDDHGNDPSPNTPDMTQSFETKILPFDPTNPPGAWSNMGMNPIVEQVFVPGQVLFDPNFPNHYPLCPAGFEGEFASCDPAPEPDSGILYDYPGVHVIAAHILELNGTLHCAQSVWRILVCPVACHCDAQGNSLDNPNCRP